MIILFGSTYKSNTVRNASYHIIILHGNKQYFCTLQSK